MATEQRSWKVLKPFAEIGHIFVVGSCGGLRDCRVDSTGLGVTLRPQFHSGLVTYQLCDCGCFS